MTTLGNDRSDERPVLAGRHWLTFFLLVLVVSALNACWAAFGPMRPALGWLRHEPVGRIARMMAHTAVPLTLFFVPLMLRGIRRFLATVLAAFAVCSGGILIATTHGGLRIASIGILVPLLLAGFFRALTGPSLSLSGRAGRAVLWVASVCLAFGPLRLAMLGPHKRSVSTSLSLVQWFDVASFGLLAMLLSWLGLLALEGRTLEHVGDRLWLRPVKRVEDEALSLKGWFGFLALSIAAGAAILPVARWLGELIDDRDVFELPIVGGMFILIGLPLYARANPRTLIRCDATRWIAGLACASLMVLWLGRSGVSATVAAASVRDWAGQLVVCFGLILALLAVGGHVEWRRRAVRGGAFLIGLAALGGTLAALHQPLHVGIAVVLSPVVLWLPVFLSDHLRFENPLSPNDGQVAKPSSALAIVPSSRVASAAVSLLAVAVVVPFGVAAAGTLHSDTCRVSSVARATEDSCNADPCCLRARPPLVLFEAGSDIRAASQEPVWWAEQHQASWIEGGFAPTLRGAIAYCNELSRLENLQPCYAQSESSVALAGCKGFRFATSGETTFGGLPADTRRGSLTHPSIDAPISLNGAPIDLDAVLVDSFTLVRDATARERVALLERKLTHLHDLGEEGKVRLKELLEQTGSEAARQPESNGEGKALKDSPGRDGLAHGRPAEAPPEVAVPDSFAESPGADDDKAASAADQPKPNRSALEQQLRSPDFRARVQAALELGASKDPMAFQPLVEALKDENTSVRAGTVAALQKLGDVRAVEPLKKLRADPSEAVRHVAEQAILALETPPPDPRGQLTDAELRLRSPDFRARVQAALELGRGKDPLAFQLLVDALKDDNSSVRAASAYALERLGDRRALEPLKHLQTDRSEGVRVAVKQAISSLDAPFGAQPKVLVQIIEVVNKSGVKSSRLATDVTQMLQVELDSLPGIDLLPAGAPFDPRGSPVVAVVASINKLAASREGTKILYSASIECVFHTMPERSIAAKVSGSATAQATEVEANDAEKSAQLRHDVLQAAVQSAIRRAPAALLAAARL